MRKILSVILLVFLLAGCAPNVPDGLKAVIEKAHPNAQFLEAKQGNFVGQLQTVWCVAYKPDPSQDLVMVELYYPETWLQPTFAGAQDINFSGIKPEGGWCYRVD